MCAQGNCVVTLTDNTSAQHDGAETWDIESVRTLVGGGSLYIIKQVSFVKQ